MLSHDEIEELQNELKSLSKQMSQIHSKLNNDIKLKNVNLTTTHSNQSYLLFNTFKKCPVCYEGTAIKGHFKCKHCLCKDCYIRIQCKICPLCRSS